MANNDTTDIEMRDNDAVQEEHLMYGHGALTEQELDEKYPNRPHNHSKTLAFSELHLTLFNPLNDNKKRPTGPRAARSKTGPHGPGHAPNDIRRSIMERFIDRWRKQVGNDIYPAFRLIVPDKDRDRPMYGLKEMTLGKLLIRIMKIDKNSEDGYNLLHWKLPGVKSSSAMAGDFAGRCFEVISKRPMRTQPGDMTIAEVNELLDRLSAAQKEENQLPIMEEFYNRMNAEELMWLIRMILRQMKIGATEKTIFERWHPDADDLFNISSSLRRVCWELYDPQIRLQGDDCGIHLMECFQPQLAAFQIRSMENIVAKMNPAEDDDTFWIEEKLDGERMQMHMVEDDNQPGGFRFGFWSRKAKDYTYLYGSGFEDDNSALTRHIRGAFGERVQNIILDGEMITWNFSADKMVPFGSLKTAAISEQGNPYSEGDRPLFRVFDCLYLNDENLTKYMLRERRKALESVITTVHRRLEIHEYKVAREAGEIDPQLRRIIAESGEGLVLKNPRSWYRLADRNDDWIKVKPEYTTEFGEALDCIVVGGYYGSGKRGGNLSSFMCGLRVDAPEVQQGANPQKCMSFFKVGGGFSADDYRQIWHRTDGKWIDWDQKKPPDDWVALAGGERQFERPDVWIKPEDSVVLEVKAGSVVGSDQFWTGWTLRFPRFKKLRTDKTWKTALSRQEFFQLKFQVEEEKKEKQIKIDETRRKRSTRKRKREMIIQGRDDAVVTTPYAGPTTKVFDGLNFYVMTEALKPIKKSKAELEQLVKANGGTIVASEKDSETIVIADRNLVKVASLQKKDSRNLVRPSWLVDCVAQSEVDIGRPSLLLPFEPRHLFYTVAVEAGMYDDNADEYGDSYSKDVSTDELMALFNKMPSDVTDGYDPAELAQQMDNHDQELDAMPGSMFRGVKAFCADVSQATVYLLQFAGGVMADSVEDGVTHVIVSEGSSSLSELRKSVSAQRPVPRIVTTVWVEESWNNGTRLDEERYKA